MSPTDSDEANGAQAECSAESRLVGAIAESENFYEKYAYGETGEGKDRTETVTKTNALGETVRVTTDCMGRETERVIKSTGLNPANDPVESTETMTKTYTDKGELASEVDSLSGVKRVYSYDKDGCLIKRADYREQRTESGGSADRVENVVELTILREECMKPKPPAGDGTDGGAEDPKPNDDKKPITTRVKEVKYDFGYESYVYAYDYDEKKPRQVNGISLPNGTWKEILRDSFGRISSQSLTYGHRYGRLNMSDSVEYAVDENGGTTDRIACVTKSVCNTGRWNDVAAYGRTTYEYDERGNVSEIRVDGELVAKYGYDNANRLVVETDADGLSREYRYDSNGNRVSVHSFSNCKCTCHSGAQAIESHSSVKYTYDFRHPDRLLKVGDETCTYDAMGNPTTYRNAACRWERGTLKEYAKGGKATTFAYDMNGLRTRKGQTEYTYVEGKLLRQTETLFDGDGEKSGENRLDFFYDESGLVGIDLLTKRGDMTSGSRYLIRRNIFGDTESIHNLLDGSLVCRYVYDAWGNHKVLNPDGTENKDESFIGNQNPIRYRGYVYDDETGLYYCKSRYYDPFTGRFISPDAIEYIEPESVNGINLYAYCGNNSVMRIDPSGHSWSSFWEGVHKAFKFIGGALLSLASVAATTATVQFIAIPGLAAIPEFFLTMTIYGGAVATSVFHEGVADDLRMIGWNPFNANAENAVASNYISFYKGAAVFRHNGNGSMGLLGMVFLHRENQMSPDWLRHEFGHTLQGKTLGIVLYGIIIGIPSLIMSAKNPPNYDSLYFERWADLWGNVSPNAPWYKWTR